MQKQIKNDFNKLTYQDLCYGLKEGFLTINEVRDLEAWAMQDAKTRSENFENTWFATGDERKVKQYRCVITWTFPLATSSDMMKYKQARYIDGQWSISKRINFTTRNDFKSQVKGYADYCEAQYFNGLNVVRDIQWKEVV